MTDKTTIINNDDLFKRISSNLKKLIKVMNWSQKQLAEMMETTPTTISNYIGEKGKCVVPPLSFLVSLCKRPELKAKNLNITVNDLLSVDFNPDIALERNTNHIEESFQDRIVKSFNGNYFCYLFDQSKDIEEQSFSIPRELRYGVMSINTVVDNITALSKTNVYARFFKSTEYAEAFGLKNELDKLSHQEYKSSDDLNQQLLECLSKEKGTYVGELKFNGQHMFIDISNNSYYDNALMIFHISSKKATDDYIGGCGSMTSVSHGEHRLPVAQKIILSRYELEYDSEIIAEHLRMSHGAVSPSSEAIEISKFCNELYSAETSTNTILTNSDKISLIETRLKQLIKYNIEKSTCCFISVTPKEDRAVYDLIKKFRQGN